MRKIYFILIIFSFIACGKSNKTKSNHQLLLGDWVTEPMGTSIHNRPHIFSVEDSVISFGAYGDYIHYKLEGNSILSTANTSFSLVSLTGDSLVMDVFVKSLSLNDTLRLGRISAKNSLVPVKIAYASSGCYGSCPSLQLEIDSTGKFIFWGGSFATHQGGYRGQLSAAQYKRIVETIHQLPDSLQALYETGWSDQQTAGVMIVTKDTTIRSSAYGFEMEPIELRILLHKLSVLHKMVSLQHDTSIRAEYFYLNGIITAPPPTPPYKIKAPR